jgi:hypothetical protein
MTTMTTDEREQWDERVSIMLAEVNPAGLTDSQVDDLHTAIDVVATKQILDQRQRNIEQMAKKNQSAFKWGEK